MGFENQLTYKSTQCAYLNLVLWGNLVLEEEEEAVAMFQFLYSTLI